MRSLLDILLSRAAETVANCLECGRCLYSCELNSFRKSEEQAKPKEKPDNLPYSLEVDTNDDPFKGIDELELN